MHVHMNTSCL